MKNLNVYETFSHGVPYFILALDDMYITEFGVDDCREDEGVDMIYRSLAAVGTKTRIVNHSPDGKTCKMIYAMLKNVPQALL